MEFNAKDKFYNELTLKNVYQYEAPAYDCTNRFETHYIYIFEDENRNEYKWSTTKFLRKKNRETGIFEDEFIGFFAKVLLKGTVKEISQYKGRPQIVLTRCSVRNIFEEGMSYEEYDEYLKREQMKNIEENGYEIKTVSYREYKEKYENYETVRDSFERNEHGCFIDIIIKEV